MAREPLVFDTPTGRTTVRFADITPEESMKRLSVATARFMQDVVKARGYGNGFERYDPNKDYGPDLIHVQL